MSAIGISFLIALGVNAAGNGERRRGREVGARGRGPLLVALRLVHQIPQQHAAVCAMRADDVRERALPARGAKRPDVP